MDSEEIDLAGIDSKGFDDFDFGEIGGETDVIDALWSYKPRVTEPEEVGTVDSEVAVVVD